MAATLPTADEVRAIVREEIRAAFASREPADDLPLDTHQAAQLAHVTPKTVRRWAASGRLRCTRQGREIRALRTDVLRAAAGGGDEDPARWGAEQVDPLRRPA